MFDKSGDQCPQAFVSQLKDMIAFADEKNDFALAAWLCQALDRMRTAHTDA
jgi:hypothetical protein